MSQRPVRTDGPIPVYVQIADYIEGDISAGRLQPHDRILTENDMHAERSICSANVAWCTPSRNEAPS